MSYPNYPHKYQETAVLTAKKLLSLRRLKGDAPETMILCYQASLLRHALKKQGGQAVAGFFGQVARFKKQQGRLGVAGNFGLGAPVTAVIVSDLAGWGVKRFIVLGLAGGLQPELAAGAPVLVNKALRDEGTSYHYLPPEPFIEPSGSLTQQLQQGLTQAGPALHVGGSWTTDAPYRETAVEIQQYQQDGLLTVEMEAAALFAVGHTLGVETAVCLLVSDSLANAQWRPDPNPTATQKKLNALFDEVINIL